MDQDDFGLFAVNVQRWINVEDQILLQFIGPYRDKKESSRFEFHIKTHLSGVTRL